MPATDRLYVPMVRSSAIPAAAGALVRLAGLDQRFVSTYIAGGTRARHHISDLWVISHPVLVHVLLVGIIARRQGAAVGNHHPILVCGTAGLLIGALSSNRPGRFLRGFYGICYVGIFSVGMAYLQVVGQRFTPTPTPPSSSVRRRSLRPGRFHLWTNGCHTPTRRGDDSSISWPSDHAGIWFSKPRPLN
jgi:hypothetical protein